MHVCSPYLTANSVVRVVVDSMALYISPSKPVSDLLGFVFESNFVFTHQLPSVSDPPKLGGGFKYFLCSPRKLGEMIQFT